jgi:hypothetical protein
MPLLNFETKGIGELGLLDELGQKMAVPIDVVYQYEYSWTIRFIVPNLAELDVSPTARLEQLPTSGGLQCQFASQ